MRNKRNEAKIHVHDKSSAAAMMHILCAFMR